MATVVKMGEPSPQDRKPAGPANRRQDAGRPKFGRQSLIVALLISVIVVGLGIAAFFAIPRNPADAPVSAVEAARDPAEVEKEDTAVYGDEKDPGQGSRSAAQEKEDEAVYQPAAPAR